MALHPLPDTSSPPPRIARFGAFELDLRSAALTRSGRPVKVQDQPARVLCHLVENAGKLVTREELRALLWPSDTFVEFDTSLNTAIRKVRQSLDDAPEAPHYIETVPRKGYRFIASVTYPIQTSPAPAPLVRLEVMEPVRAAEQPPPATPEAVPAAGAVASPRWSRTFVPAAGAILAITGIGYWSAGMRNPAVEAPPERFSFDIPSGLGLANQFGPSVAISANGRIAAYVAAPASGPRSIYYHRLSDGANQKIPGTEGAAGIILAPDGERIAFRHDGWLVAATLDGQNRRRLAQAGNNIPEGGLWTDRDEIYFTAASKKGNNRLNTALWRVRANQPDQLEELTPLLDPGSGLMEWHLGVRELPSGDLLISVARGPTREVWIVGKNSSEKKLLVKGTGGYYSPTGHLIYHRGTTLYAAPVNLSRRELTGPEAAIQTHVGVASWSGGNIGISRDGTLVFTQQAKTVPNRTLTWTGLDGKETPISIPPGPYAVTDLSPDERFVLVAKYEDFEAQWGLWLMPLGPGEWKNVSDGHSLDVAGVFAEDGKSVLFNRMGTGLMRRRLDSPATEECLSPELDFTRYPAPFARGQREILFTEGYRPTITTLLYSLPLGPSPGPPRQLSRGESGVRLSPDLKWLAGMRYGKVMVRPYPVSDTDSPLIAGTGWPPVWSPDGRTIYYVNAAREMVAVPFRPGPPPSLGPARVLFNAARYDIGSRWHAGYLLGHGGKAFLVARNEYTAPVAPVTTIQVVRNWFTEVRRLAHPGSR